MVKNETLCCVFFVTKQRNGTRSIFLHKILRTNKNKKEHGRLLVHLKTGHSVVRTVLPLSLATVELERRVNPTWSSSFQNRDHQIVQYNVRKKHLGESEKDRLD